MHIHYNILLMTRANTKYKSKNSRILGLLFGVKIEYVYSDSPLRKFASEYKTDLTSRVYEQKSKYCSMVWSFKQRIKYTLHNLLMLISNCYDIHSA